MAASSFSPLLLLFFLSQLLSTAFTSMHGFIDDPLIQQVVSPDSHGDLLASAEHQFLAFKREYGKTYPTEEEDDYRFGVFMSNLRQARRNEINDPTAVYGVTKFSDLTPSEFRRKYSGSSPQIESPLPNDDCNKAPILSTDGLPEKWNWKENHSVTPVKDQGNACNSCWAFSTIAVIEGAHYLVNNKLVNLSEQQLIACSQNTCFTQRPERCNMGCDGGNRILAFKYVNKSGVVEREHYPFRSAWENDECEVQNKIAASIHNYSCIDEEEQYKPHLVKHGPIAVNININLLHCYQRGIVCPPKKLLGDKSITQHAVTLVGYDSGEHGEPFHWIVKNSYGKDWGEDGYFRVCEGVLTTSAMGIYAIAMNQTAGFHQIN